MIYLASPYSHPDPLVREFRFREACRAAAKFMRCGQAVFSPIAHGHCICTYGLPTDWRFWEPLDRCQLERCDEVVVLMLDGWRESVGVQAEIRIAAECNKPVRYVFPENLPAAGQDRTAVAARQGHKQSPALAGSEGGRR